MKIEKVVKKNGSTVYRAKVYLGINSATGKKTRSTITGRTRSEVKLKYQQKLSGFRANGNTLKPKSSVTTFEELTALWWESKMHTLKPHSIINYKSMLNKHILPIFGNYKLKSIKPAMIQIEVNQWARVHNDENDGYRYYDRLVTLMSNIFKHGVSLQILESNPCQNVIIPRKKVTEKKSVEFLDNQKLKTFLDYLDSLEDTFYNVYCSTLYRLAIASGCRIGELLALEWSDVDFKDGSISITKTLNQKGFINPPKTKSSNRIVSLDGQTMSILKRYQLKQRKEAMRLGSHETLLFSSFKGGYSNNNIEQYRLDKHLKACKLGRFTFHKFRHTHASFLLNNTNLGYKEISERLGHSKISITIDLYSHLQEDNKKQVAEIFGQALSNL